MSAAATLFASCTPGLEAVLERELQPMSSSARAVVGGVEATGDFMRLNLWSRIATRVLLRVAEVRSPAELKGVALAPFRQAGAPVAFHVTGDDVGAWKQAASDAFKPLGEGGLEVHVRVASGRATVSVDTSGELLHMRGFRQETGKAPLRETLASGVLALAQWQPTEPLWDIMCGSGTLLIEAAEQQAGLAPGRARRFAFETFPSFDEAAFKRLERTRPAVVAPLMGSDLNAGALGVARRNARRAGVLDRLKLERLDATTLTRPVGEPGLVVANLPYGRRVGAGHDMAKLYASVGKTLKRGFAGWRFAFLLETGAEALGLPMTAEHRVSNGGLHCSVVVGRIAP